MTATPAVPASNAIVNPADEGPLSPWWLRSIGIVMLIGFGVLIAITALAYRNAPPIPGKVLDAQGNTLFTSEDVGNGQAVFLKYGLMDNGSIWGHGAYLGPDYAADALHRMGVDTGAALSQSQFGKPVAQLDAMQRAALQADVAMTLKTNRYDSATNALTLTPAETQAWQQQLGYWTDYFKHPASNGGLKPDLISDPGELRQFTAFVTWAAWASVANRPGEDYSYTNNFPFDPSVGNTAIPGALLWSALSLLVLLAGIAAVLLAFGKFDYLGWISHGYTIRPHVHPGEAGPGQRALVKFFIIVALVFLFQTLVGGATAHYRADPGSFYGFQLENIFPSNLMRTWHLQSAIMWIATSYVAAALFLARTLRRDEPKGLAMWTHLLFVAFVAVIAGSLLGEWLGMSQLLGKWWFWLGDQGWEYLELGRIWQYLLAVGLLVWFALLWWLARPRNVGNTESRPIVRMFFVAALAIPVFYLPAMFFGAKTNYTVVDTWRFWIIHLWVEGFFEFFATTVVAVILLPARADPPQHGAAGGLSRRHPVFPGRPDRHRTPLVLHRPDRLQHGFVGAFSALEVVPLTLLTLDAWDFVRTTRGEREVGGKPIVIPHKWTFYFLMAVGFWNFVGAGIFGFLINLPIVSYYEVGTHTHTQPRPRGHDGRVRHAGDGTDGVRAAPDDRRGALAGHREVHQGRVSGAPTSGWR